MNGLVRCKNMSGYDVWICLQHIKYIYESEIAGYYDVSFGDDESIAIDKKSFNRIYYLIGV